MSEASETASKVAAACALAFRSCSETAIPVVPSDIGVGRLAHSGQWQINPFRILLGRPAAEGTDAAQVIEPERGGVGHWIIRVPRDGETPVFGCDIRYRTGPIEAMPCRLAARAAGSRAVAEGITILVPEGACPSLDAAFRAHLSRELAKPHALLLGRHLLAVAEFLPVAAEEDLPLLAEVVKTVLTVALSADCEGRAMAEGDTRARLRGRVEAVIAHNIGSARLDAARIAKLAGISRTTLYRIFEGSAGVAAHVRMIRLEGVCAALRDPAQASVAIAAIAERHGFHSVASFNRAFRRAYGTTPGDMRTAIRAPRPEHGIANLPRSIGAIDPQVRAQP